MPLPCQGTLATWTEATAPLASRPLTRIFRRHNQYCATLAQVLWWYKPLSPWERECRPLGGRASRCQGCVDDIVVRSKTRSVLEQTILSFPASHPPYLS